jgi:hypothetical protein
MSETKSTIPPRPTWNDEMNKELAKYTGEILNKWCNNNVDLEECIEYAEDVLKWHKNDDGYTLAKEFEDKGFSPDSQLVDELDCVSYESIQILERHNKKWVAENNLKLVFEVGDQVLVKLSMKGTKECEIMKLYPETMQYVVWYEGQGSIKGTGGTIVNSENVLGHISSMA